MSAETNNNARADSSKKDKKKAEKDKEKDDEDEKHGGLDIGSLVHRAEKKVLMSFVGRKSLRPFLDDRSYSLIDALYRMRREYVALERLRSECGFDADQIANQLAAVGGSSSASKQARHVVHEARKDADKFVHNFIKILLKIGLLVRQENASTEILRQAEALRQLVRKLLMTVVSFVKVEFSFERSFLVRQLAECAQAMHSMATAGKLTEKSHRRIDLVFGALGEPAFLDRVFSLGPRAVAHLQNNNLSTQSQSQSQTSGSSSSNGSSGGTGTASATSSGYSTPGVASVSSSPSKHSASSASGTDFHGFDADWRTAISRQLAIAVSALDSLLEDGTVL